jgi:hypothetical protein
MHFHLKHGFYVFKLNCINPDFKIPLSGMVKAMSKLTSLKGYNKKQIWKLACSNVKAIFPRGATCID